VLLIRDYAASHGFVIVQEFDDGESSKKDEVIGMSGIGTEPQPIIVDQHYSPGFYAELWGISESTVVRWFQDMDGVLKLSRPSKNGKRTRIELRIPDSLAMREYRRRTQS